MTCATPETDNWTRGTVEYLQYAIKADVELNTQPVHFTFDRVTFLAAEWIGTDTEVSPGVHQRTARLLVTDDDLPDGFAAEVYVRVTDNPEIPLIPAGTLSIT